jgi:hypothetical protein
LGQYLRKTWHKTPEGLDANDWALLDGDVPSASYTTTFITLKEARWHAAAGVAVIGLTPELAAELSDQ